MSEPTAAAFAHGVDERSGGELAVVRAVNGAEYGLLVAHQVSGLSGIRAEVEEDDDLLPSDDGELAAIGAEGGPGGLFLDLGYDARFGRLFRDVPEVQLMISSANA